MNYIKSIDLNLLIVFDAVYRNKNISHAAKEIGLTQPSVSAALKRLRDLTNDELFTRLSRGVSPTQRSHEIYESVSKALALIEKGFSPGNDFDIKNYKKEYYVGMVDLFMYTFLPKLLALLEEEAPNIKIIPLPFSQSNFAKELRSGHFDFTFATTGYSDNIEGFYSRHLFNDRYCIISKKNHPHIKKKLTLKRYLECQHIVTSFEGKMKAHVDNVLEELGHKRDVSLSVPNFLSVPFVVSSTNILAAFSEQCAMIVQKDVEIDIHKVPFDLEELDTRLYWHNSFEHDPAKEWLISKIIEICNE